MIRLKNWLWLCLLLSSQLAQASINSNPQFEFGTIPTDQCTISGPTVSCDIEFEQTYTSPPLVFVMSTINASHSNFASKTTEYPSALRVWSVSNSKAVIKQRVAPHGKACKQLKYKKNNKNQWLWQCVNNSSGELVSYVDSPMDNIDYLVIEPGVLEFDNGAKIVAGSYSTKKTISGKSGDGSGTLIDFSSYGLNSNFSSAPGVLVQLQSRKNYSGGEPVWLTTTAKNPTSNSVTVMLDRSEVTNNSDLAMPEKVGFVAGLGEGFVNGRKFWLGQGSTQNTLQLDDKVIKPVTEGCMQVVNFLESGFKKIPTLIASKSARYGPNGGWLRRCSVTKTGVSLIVEEDMSRDAERSHTLEPFSYFLFDKPPVSGVCSLFPSPAQTWASNNQASITIENNANISGAPISGGKRYIGFAQSDVTDRKSKGCDGTECFGDTGLRVTKQQLESFQAPDSGLETVIVQKNQTRTFQNSESIGTLTINKKASLIFKSGKYWIDSINVLGNVEIPDGEIVEIHTKGFALSNGSHFKAVGGGELVVYVHDLSYNGAVIHNRVDLANDSKFIGLLYSEKDVILSNKAIIEGAVTAKTVTLNNGSEIIATNKCFEPADDYKVTITPATDLALMCGDETPQFTITTTNNNLAESLEVTASITPDSNKFTITPSAGFGSGNYPDFISNTDGLLELKVTPNDTGVIDLSQSYLLKITMKADMNQFVQSQFKFVPFKFDVSDQKVIAGKEYDVTTTVLACDNTGQTVAKSYTGTPIITHSVDKPISGVGGSLIYGPKFVVSDEGLRQDTLSIDESGDFSVTLTDSNFDCTGLSDCPIDGSGILRGGFTLSSRPWTFAVCSTSGTTTGGDASGGSKFIAAGETFSLYVKPVIWDASLDVIDSDSNQPKRLVQKKEPVGNPFCSLDVTTNFFKSDSTLNTTVNLSNSLATPSGGELGEAYTGSIGNISPSSELEYADVSVTEVGSFHFTASTSNAFYNGILGGIDDGARELGRFYPKYFTTIGTPIWDYPGSGVSEQSFAYMNQLFDGVEFEVEALNSLGNAIENYASFDSTLTAGFSLFEPNFGDRFNSPVPNKVWTANNNRSIGTFTLSQSSPSTDCDSELCLEKLPTADNYEDGPYNGATGTVTDISITHTGSADDDPVAYLNEEGSRDPQRLTQQPEILFGRVDLDDVGGNSETTITIPLRTEYWNGSRFVVNDADSTTNIAASTSASNVIWSEDDSSATTATLSDGGQVSGGESRNLTASQNPGVNTREQVQLWQSMDDTPWLRYDWGSDKVSDVNGEQDPSTVVTFGIYRGNDRVIYRGESGLTGQ